MEAGEREPSPTGECHQGRTSRCPRPRRRTMRTGHRACFRRGTLDVASALTSLLPWHPLYSPEAGGEYDARESSAVNCPTNLGDSSGGPPFEPLQKFHTLKR